jgi:aminocarboxymuconate-semialdehyde decarboxylase
MNTKTKSPFFKIDIHTHIMPKDIPKWADSFGYGGFIYLEHHKPCCAKMMIDDEFFREVQDNCWSPEARLRDCEEADVNVQVLSPIPVLFHYWATGQHAHDTSRFFNDHIADVIRRYPTRFAGLGTLPMQEPDLAIKELERCILELGLSGVEIGTHVNELNLDAEELFPIFQRAEELGAAVFVHPWDMMGKSEMEKYWLPWLVGMPAETSRAICSMIFGGVFERLPNLKVAFAHGGGSFPGTVSRVQHGYDVRPDLCAVNDHKAPKDYLGHFYLDSLVHDEKMLNYLIDLVGEDKIALGSDYPFPLGEHVPGKMIEDMDLHSDVKERILSGTALEWLGKSLSDFQIGSSDAIQSKNN